jgi:hypothetical protein
MTKRRLIRWSLILVIFAAFAVWLEPTRVVWGWLRGEAFYKGRPTSYWASQIGRWQLCGKGYWNWREDPREAWWFSYKSNSLEKWIERYSKFDWPAFPAILDDDPETHVVLEELAVNSDPHVRDVARERLRGTIMSWMRIHGALGY